MPGSVDLEYAKIVANHLGTDHHQIQISKEDFLNAIETVIYNIESFDTTTVRASVGNYLVSKFIRENSDCKVIFNGDGSDEVCGGYVYMKNAPNGEDFQSECKRLLDEIHLFDVLRSDRSISSNGLEARTPFLDKDFVQYYLSIPAKMKLFDGKMRLEKHLLRKAFNQSNLLPDAVLWRRKCAFSDGVSAKENSWHRVIQTFVDNKISDGEFETNAKSYTHCTPVLKESYYYRKVYESFFGNQEKLIPHFWMPKWVETKDPSARELIGYVE
jgi:asparagine synthase (glutamine-hydrolysing)